ncbi:Stress response protein NST1 [Mycena kentingensis (nom. inval.)]|nr:Stress response protein NST1 [Mycena kentingensis (nom. inval.)]
MLFMGLLFVSEVYIENDEPTSRSITRRHQSASLLVSYHLLRFETQPQQMGKKRNRNTATVTVPIAVPSLDTEGQEALTAAALAATNELISTAKELYMSLGGTASEMNEVELGEAEDAGIAEVESEVKALLGAEAWRSLPRSIKSFVSGVYRMRGSEAAGGLAQSVREAAAALVPSPEPAVSVEPVAAATPAMAPPPAPPPSSVSIGKKPMAYQQTPAPPATAPRSARAAAKAPATYQDAPPKGKAQPAKPAAAADNNKIWSTSSAEERERIRDFWLQLAEDERRDLVRVEKDTVLRKMKEEQKHSCSCAVCGRKRTAIEDELQVLYDAYYEDLEQYAMYQQQYLSSNRTLPPPPGPGPFPGSVEVDRYGAVVAGSVGYPPATPRAARRKKKGRRRARKTDEEEEDDVYEEEVEEPDEGEDDEEPPPPTPAAPPAVNGRARLPASRGGRPAGGGRGAVDMKGKITASVGTGVGGPNSILTVADDLLKNDGRKFLEMMEQLAERRLAREEEAAGGVSGDDDDSQSSASLDGEDGASSDAEDGESEGEEEEGESEGESGDEDGDSGDDEDEDEDEDAPMTDAQKMEEGKRMFSIFAARMFEQRVLQAYRERVAQERQAQLLRELADEDEHKREKEAKKQNQNQKKKDKKRQQKAAKEEKEASRAAERAAEEAALKAKQAAADEEQRKRREEEKARREAARKAQDEEKARKEEERRKRVAEEKEREAERERKRKEKEEKLKAERREKEERERKAKEEREAKAAKERAAQLAAAKEKEEKEKERKRLAKEKEEKEAKEKAQALQQQQQQQRAAAAAKARSAAASSTTHIAPPMASSSSGSSQRPAVNGSQPKKILNKQAAVPVPVPNAMPVSPLNASAMSVGGRLGMSPPQLARPGQGLHAHSLSMTTSLPQASMQQIPPNAMYQQPPMSPRSGFAPTPFGFAPSPSTLQAPQGIPASARGFPAFDPAANASTSTSFHRAPGLPPLTSPTPAPIGPPTKLAPGAGRRPSLMGEPLSPGPIGRPAPIARPPPTSATSAGDSSGSASPAARRSPSPKGVLGSAALLADDDEVVPVRRPVGATPISIGIGIGGTWAPGRAGPGSAVGSAPMGGTPWATAGAGAAPAPVSAAPGGFNGAPIGAGRAGMWGGTSPVQDWHPMSASSASPFQTRAQNGFLGSSTTPPGAN